MTLSGLMLAIQGGSWLTRALIFDVGEKVFNDDNETFPQNDLLIQDEDWINFDTETHLICPFSLLLYASIRYQN